MRAMTLERANEPLLRRELPVPTPGSGEVLLRVHTCGVCRTDLHVADGELAHPKLPLILGHEIVGTVVAHGTGAGRFSVGTRVGVPWLGNTCGACGYCLGQRENLCPKATFNGYQRDGGYTEYTVAREDFVFALPPAFDDLHAAPLLCAGLIGFRAYRLAGDAQRIGLYGFGAAAHILAQVATQQGRRVYAFTRDGDEAAQSLARRLGAVFAGGSHALPPEPLDAAIVFAPDGSLVPTALYSVAPGGTVVCAGIHMSDIPSFPYSLLWQERSVRSVANLTRRDGEEFFAALASGIRVETSVTRFALEDANDALASLRAGRVTGAAVLDCGG